mgnify:CR=1 FL=1|tara:strand:- start:591 stop:965 length:375 start_codon:yes stop_codon:yes gene_type:complete
MEQVVSINDFSLSLKTPGQATIDVGRFREHFGLSQQALAHLARVHRATVADAPSNEKLQCLMRNFLRVVSAAAGIAGDEERAIYWMRNTPIPEFDHRTAMDLVAEGKIEAVVKYLLSIESGSSG